jgi:hypothetical protein
MNKKILYIILKIVASIEYALELNLITNINTMRYNKIQ